MVLTIGAFPQAMATAATITETRIDAEDDCRDEIFFTIISQTIRYQDIQ